MKSAATRVWRVWQVATVGCTGVRLAETIASFPFAEQDAIDFARETNGTAPPQVQVERSLVIAGLAR